MSINWRFVLGKFWQITLIGLLIAIGIIFFPQAQCAVAQTCNEPADLWCGKTKCCSSTGGMKYVTNCSGEYSNSPYRCNSSSGNCNVSDWMGWQWETRTYNSRTQAHMPDCVNGVWKPNQVWAYVDCCGGSSSSGGGCTPSYAPPTIDDTYMVDPPNPIVWGQEQPPYGLALGMTVNDIKAHGGQDTACGTGQAKITSVTINLTLTQDSIDWILGELSQRYINVHIKDTYPKYPEIADVGHAYASCSSTSGLTGYNTPNAELDCRFFRPLDPGKYAVNVTACQSDGKCTAKTLPEPIRVWLLESRLLAPEP